MVQLIDTIAVLLNIYLYRLYGCFIVSLKKYILLKLIFGVVAI